MKTIQQQRSEAIHQIGREVGFDLVGIAAAEALTEAGTLLQEWLAMGYHGQMEYMNRMVERRCDPREVMPEARSVIVVARNYYTDHHHTNAPGEGKLSRYSWGDDYHEVMNRLLSEFCRRLEDQFEGSTHKPYVDTGPVMEKEWAVRAGVGWQGKHSNILTQGVGSYFFLGVVLSSLECAYNDPVTDRCGTCTACIEACPTTAIVQPYVVDATKCISYWTIESPKDEPFPARIREYADDWLFGCDVCQEVCPWNRFSTQCGEPAFEPRLQQTSLNLDQVINFTQEEFSARFTHSPVKRAKVAGLKRNARELIAARTERESSEP